MTHFEGTMVFEGAFNMTQFRAILAGQGVTVHGVLLGPVDTDMIRGFENTEGFA